jgi:hypothetical protein
MRRHAWEVRMVREISMQHLSPTSDMVIVRKARHLIAQAATGAHTAEALGELSRGFMELSALADERRLFRMACVARALSSIFGKIPNGNPDDQPFIIHIAMNFLEAIQNPARPAGEA